MSDPTTTPSVTSPLASLLSALGTRFSAAVPAAALKFVAWPIVIFGALWAFDYAMGFPVRGYVLALSAEKAKAVSLPTPAVDLRIIQRIKALEEQAANRVQMWSDMESRISSQESNLKALELIVEYNVGRTIRMEELLKKKPSGVKSVPVAAAKTEAVKPAEPAPMVQIGGAP